MLRRPIARAGRPRVLGTVARTAVVAGTATAVSGRVARRQQNRAQQAYDAQAYEQEQQMAAQEAAAPPPAYAPPQPAYAPPPPAAAPDPIAQLKDLATLRDQGVLTEDEFAAQKARILGS
jgi:hypothetical protein